MSYTEEDIKGMSDREIEFLILDIVTDGKATEEQEKINRNMHLYQYKVSCPTLIIPKYCTDWSATGPLMVEYGIGLDPPDKELKDSKYWWANHGIIPKMSRHERQDWDIQVGDKNPLRAICEVILMINLKEEQSCKQ